MTTQMRLIQMVLPEELTPELCQLARYIMCSGVPGVTYWAEVIEAGPYYASKYDKPDGFIIVKEITAEGAKEIKLSERQILQGAVDVVNKHVVNSVMIG